MSNVCDICEKKIDSSLLYNFANPYKLDTQEIEYKLNELKVIVHADFNINFNIRNRNWDICEECIMKSIMAKLLYKKDNKIMVENDVFSNDVIAFTNPQPFSK